MTIITTPPKGHIVAFALHFWGHTKSLCALVAKLVRVQPVIISIFVAVPLLEKVKIELARYFLPEGEDHLKNSIRVIGVPSEAMTFDLGPIQAEFLKGYSTLMSKGPIQCAPDNDAFYEAVRAPQLVILDFFCYTALQGVRDLSGTSVPVYAWQSGSAAAVLVLFGPESMGGGGDLAAKLEHLVIEDGETRDDAAEKIYRKAKGDLISMPGLPPMYDYELAPQNRIYKFSAAFILSHSHRFFENCDGVIHGSSQLYEGKSIAAWKTWLGNRPVLTIGPFSFADVTSIERERDAVPGGEDVEHFLESTLEKYGEHSLVYISFGTLAWMTEPEKIWAFLDVLIELSIPFTMSHASQVATVPDEVKQKVAESGLGFIAPWLPQQLILHHKACGWFVSHCGHNSTMESLTEGVPLICWPFDADQPMNAANLTLIHNVAYELFEVRTGYGLRPIHRLDNRAPEGTLEAVRREARDVLTKARGADGEIKRANAVRMSKAIFDSWKEGGACWQEMRKVFDVLD